MRMSRRVTATVTAAVVTATGLIGAVPARAAGDLTVWTDAAHAPVIEQLTSGGFADLKVNVVVKDPSTVRQDLAAASGGTAPDVVWGDLAWTGELAAAKQIVPIRMTKKIEGQFRTNVLNGSRVAADRYGVPVQISNLALITNTKLVPKQPTTFAALSSLALALKKDKKAKVPFALPQGEGTSPYTTFPLFSGIGGYLFGRDASGSLNPNDVGLASKKLRKNAGTIDRWNASGLIDASLTADAARTAFAKGKSPFWLAGPEELPNLLKLSFAYRIGSVPPIIGTRKAVPLLTVQGFMVTRFAAKHGVEDQAMKLAAGKMARAKAQLALAAVNGWFPANTKAAETVPTGGGRIRAIGNAGVDGVPMPNIPQAGSVWGPYATAWTAATSGASATPAKAAFRVAQKAAVAAIG